MSTYFCPCILSALQVLMMVAEGLGGLYKCNCIPTPYVYLINWQLDFRVTGNQYSWKTSHEALNKAYMTYSCTRDHNSHHPVTTFSLYQVSKDERSDIESSSEEEPETTATLPASAKRENGTNGHFGSQPWTRKDENWWRHSRELSLLQHLNFTPPPSVPWPNCKL